MKTNTITVLIALITFLMITNANSGSRSVFDTKHNLSTSGKGDVTATSETRVCIFCHSSHNASSEGPLWNHKTTSTGKFQTYQRSTMVSTPEQPNGSTKLCLSCHDGTIAVGAIRGRATPIPMKNVGSTGKLSANKSSHIGTDLSGTHPVSLKYDQSLALSSTHLKWPIKDSENKVGTDKNGYVQCTSCHDPHDDSKSEKYPFWNKATFSEVCKTCHKF